jgi:membrane-associated phospholipid phosphatase
MQRSTTRLDPLFSRSLFIGLLFLLVGQGAAQRVDVFSPYQEGIQSVDAILLGIGGSLTTTSILLDRRVSPLTDEDFSLLEFRRYLPLDEYSTRHFSSTADLLSDKAILAAFASPFFLLFNKRTRANAGTVGLIAFEGALINAGLINLTKVTVRRPRPFVFNDAAPLEMKRMRNARFSFFSGHAATSAYFSMVTAKLYNDFYPDSNARPYVWAGAALIPVLTSYGRMRAGRHYFSDVLVGTLVGTGIALLVPTLHRR